MKRSLVALLTPCTTIILLFNSLAQDSLAQTQDVRTLNYDFGNGATHIGGGGILSSPGGTFWNSASTGAELLDEFGQSFGLTGPFGETYPDLFFFDSFGSTPITTSAAGPLDDGVQFTGGSLIFIRELSRFSPVDVAVYFTRPLGSLEATSTISVGSFDFDIQTATNPTGLFPGLAGQDFLLLEVVSLEPTTLGFPMLPGVVIGVPELSVANIAAIQVRGVFTLTPEPGTLLLAGLAGLAGWLPRPTRQSQSS